jgi:hypothetical protein
MVVLGELLISRVHELAPGISLEMEPLSTDMPEIGRDPLQYDLLIAPAEFRSGGQSQIICRGRFVCGPGQPQAAR